MTATALTLVSFTIALLAVVAFVVRSRQLALRRATHSFR
jgi:hypothetical protein